MVFCLVAKESGESWSSCSTIWSPEDKRHQKDGKKIIQPIFFPPEHLVTSVARGPWKHWETVSRRRQQGHQQQKQWKPASSKWLANKCLPHQPHKGRVRRTEQLWDTTQGLPGRGRGSSGRFHWRMGLRSGSSASGDSKVWQILLINAISFVFTG